MQVCFIGPTDDNKPTVGQVLSQLLEEDPKFKKAVLVSAFVNGSAIYHLGPSMERFIKNGGQLCIVVGIDLQSTTKESLQYLLDKGFETFIFKNRKYGHTFHPKLYYFESNERCVIIVGSSNLTPGGAFTNYEANLRVDFDLTQKEDKSVWQQLYTAISKYINPEPPLAKRLTSDFLEKMVNRGDVICEQDRRRFKIPDQKRVQGVKLTALLYGMESMPSSPPLPKHLVEPVVRSNRKVKTVEPSKAIIPMEVQAFYMTLNKLQGPTIPGEARIPLKAIRALPEFWEWPNRYISTTKSRGKIQRVYREWKPQWEIIDGQTQQSSVEAVRMYLYEASMDFRFYSSQLVHLKANEGDLVIIRRLDDPDVVFQCEWINQSNQRFEKLKSLATQKVPNPKDPNNPRWWGYA